VRPLQRAGLALLVSMAMGAAFWLASQHPVAPLAVMAGVWLVGVSTAWRPGAWLFWLPALMPVLNFFPWTGWWLVDESDLFVLAVLAGGYARWAVRCDAVRWPGPPRWLLWLLAGLAVCVAQAVWRGWQDAPPLPPHTGWADAFRQGLFADPLSAWNSVRVAKSFVWAGLLAPLAWRAIAVDREAAGLNFVRGMVAGLALVGVLVLWERETQVGLLDFVSGYRTSAAFWEMHVGGGAIDAYLALTAPMALWAVWMAPTRQRWWLALALLWLTIYVLLTTYSRGVMGAFVIVVLGWALAARVFHLPHDGHGPGRRRVVAATLIGLLIQSAVVIGTGAFFGDRLEQTSKDLLGRWAHWQRGLGLLQAPVSDGAGWWGGLGMGRFTAQYHGLGVESELPGRATWQRAGEAGRGVLTLDGPESRDVLALQFGLTQRVGLREPEGYTVRMRLAGKAGDEVLVSVCQRHLIHTLMCQWSSAAVAADDLAGTRAQAIRLRGHPLQTAASGGETPAVLSLHPMRAGQRTQVLAVQLRDASGRQLLRNTDFADGLTHWMPAAEAYYQPWHIDNFYLDLLLELGLTGGLLLAGLAWGALVQVRRGLGRSDPLAWAQGAALLGFLAVGAVISVTEVPRVLLLVLLTGLMTSTQWTEGR
jgi:hypothetical protein